MAPGTGGEKSRSERPDRHTISLTGAATVAFASSHAWAPAMVASPCSRGGYKTMKGASPSTCRFDTACATTGPTSRPIR
jgi:hypothetical protein